MTQPQEAVGGSDEPVIAAEPTLEDRFSAVAQEEEDPKEGAGDAAKAAEPELTEEDVAEEDEAEQPPIDPPVSLTAEEKDAFRNWPREAQEVLTRRVGELEKGFQSKAQEASRAEAKAHAEASEAFRNVASTFAQQLASLRVQLPGRPTHQLQADDPYEYAEQMDAYERAAAHNQWIEQQLRGVSRHVQQLQAADYQREQMETLTALQSEFPEYLDDAKGPEIRQRLGSTALELGYSAEQIATADHRDIKAMKLATDWREKAEKYDKLMSKKMEKVREAKDLPNVSRPGTAQGKGAVANQRYTADREAMRKGDRDAGARVFGRFL